MCRLLHAAPEEEHTEILSDSEQDLTSCLSELYQSSTAGSNGNQKSKKREYSVVHEARIFVILTVTFISFIY